MTEPEPRYNKFWAAVEVLNRGRDVVIDSLADEILFQADDLVDGGFLFNEFVEAQGTRVHFLCLLISQLEQAAEALDERLSRSNTVKEPKPASASAPKKRKTRAKTSSSSEAKKVTRRSPKEDQADEV